MKRTLTIFVAMAWSLPAWVAGQAQSAQSYQQPSISTAQQSPSAAGEERRESRAFPFSRNAGFLGIGIQQVTAERAKTLKLKDDGGVEITRLGPESPADRAGLKVGDVIVQFNGTRVEGIEQFSILVRESPVGHEAKVQIFRNGAEQTIPVKIGQRPLALALADGNFRMPDVPRIFPGLRSPMLGVEAEPIDGQFAEFFGVKDGGVLVHSVMRNSAAEKAGLRAGDVILRVDEVKVATPADITSRLRSLNGKSAPVALMREHKEMTVTVTIDFPEMGTRRGGRVEPVHLLIFEPQ